MNSQVKSIGDKITQRRITTVVQVLSIMSFEAGKM